MVANAFLLSETTIVMIYVPRMTLRDRQHLVVIVLIRPVTTGVDKDRLYATIMTQRDQKNTVVNAYPLHVTNSVDKNQKNRKSQKSQIQSQKSQLTKYHVVIVKQRITHVIHRKLNAAGDFSASATPPYFL